MALGYQMCLENIEPPSVALGYQIYLRKKSHLRWLSNNIIKQEEEPPSVAIGLRLQQSGFATQPLVSICELLCNSHHNG